MKKFYEFCSFPSIAPRDSLCDASGCYGGGWLQFDDLIYISDDVLEGN